MTILENSQVESTVTKIPTSNNLSCDFPTSNDILANKFRRHTLSSLNKRVLPMPAPQPEIIPNPNQRKSTRPPVTTKTLAKLKDQDEQRLLFESLGNRQKINEPANLNPYNWPLNSASNVRKEFIRKRVNPNIFAPSLLDQPLKTQLLTVNKRSKIPCFDKKKGSLPKNLKILSNNNPKQKDHSTDSSSQISLTKSSDKNDSISLAASSTSKFTSSTTSNSSTSFFEQEKQLPPIDFLSDLLNKNNTVNQSGTWRLRETYLKPNSTIHKTQSKNYLDKFQNSVNASENPISTTTTISTESSFSQMSLSDFSSNQINQASQFFRQNQQNSKTKSTALCYYHHLYNQRTAESTKNLLPLYNYTYMNGSKEKFSDYGSTRFSSKQENYSGNYSKSKSPGRKLSKTSDSDEDSASEKSLDELITALLNSPFKSKPLAPFKNHARKENDFGSCRKVCEKKGQAPKSVMSSVDKQLTLLRQFKKKAIGFKEKSPDKSKIKSPIYENLSMFNKNSTLDACRTQNPVEYSFETTKNSSRFNDSKLEISLSDIKPKIISSSESVNLGKPLNICIDTNRVDAGVLTADITLNEEKVHFDLIKLNATKYQIKLTPTNQGVYKVRILLNGLTVKGSPFIIRINSSSTNSNQDKEIKGKPSVCSFRTELCDTSSAATNLVVGKEFQLRVFVTEKTSDKESSQTTIVKNAKITASVKFNNSEPVEHILEANPDGSFKIIATPQRPGNYFVSFYKDERRIEGSPYKLVVSGRMVKKILKPSYSQVGKPYILTLENYNPRQTRIEINKKRLTCLESSSLTSVSKSISSTTIDKALISYEKIIEEQNKLVVRFVPMEAVEYWIEIFEGGKLITECPIRLNVFPNPESFLIKEKVTPVQVSVGDTAKFNIKLNDNNMPINIRVLNTTSEQMMSYHVTFLLNEYYTQTKHIYGALCKFLRLPSADECICNEEVKKENDHQTRVSFFMCNKIAESGNPTTLNLLHDLKEIIDNEKYVIIDISKQKTIMAVPHSLSYIPKGSLTEYTLKKISCDLSLVEFRLNAVGNYRVDFENFSKKMIQNSPCYLNVYDSSKAVILHLPERLFIGTENFFKVDFTGAGTAKFLAWAETPSGLVIEMPLVKNSQKLVKINPNESGSYLIHMKFGDECLKNTPFRVEAVKSELPIAQGSGLYTALENQPAVFKIIAPDNLEGNLNIEIKSSDMATNVRSFVKKLNNNEYDVTYFAMETGILRIFIKWNDQPIHGSPFKARVINPAKVQLLGINNIQHSANSCLKNIYMNVKLNEQKTLVFDTHEAGPGCLNVQILSDKYETIPFKKIIHNNLQKIYFSLSHDGEFRLNFDWSNYPISTPTIIAHSEGYALAEKIIISGEGATKAFVNKLASLKVDCTRAYNINKLRAFITNFITNGTSSKILVDVTESSKNIYNLTYTPIRAGSFLIHVMSGDLHLGGSPFELQVEMEADPSKVVVNKNEVKTGIINTEIRTLIDASNSGPGEITAYCYGPKKIAKCCLEDKENGYYMLSVLPQEVGKHQLQIRFNGVDVVGSPFVLRVFSPPDASKVKVEGTGIVHGVLGDFKSEFVCDTKGAGAGQLTVRIRGPKNAFKVEMKRESEKDRKITCKYDPLEAGEYQINVKWSGEHVPNSPFNVRIFKISEEFAKFLAVSQSESLEIKKDYTFQSNSSTGFSKS